MPESLPPTPMPGAQRSIHYRRRWAYVLWVALLLLSSGALALWERPLAMTSAGLSVRLHLRDVPQGVQVKVWAGPWSRWTGAAQFTGAPIQVPLSPDGNVTLPLFHIPIAQRRWFKGYIPRGTWDLMMLEFSAPGQPPRYFPLPLTRDLRTGTLHPGWRLVTSLNLAWSSLQTEAKPPDEAP